MRTLFLRGVLGVLLLAAAAAHAQSYPAKSVRIVVPFAAGGPADNYARFIGQRLGEALGQPFVVDNKPGAGSIIGTDIVAKAPADGYTLLMMSNTHTVNETLIPGKPFVLMRDFVPVAPVNYSDLVLVTHPALPVKNLQDVMRLAKDKPGKYNYASTGNGAGTHMAFAEFNARLGLDMVHVPYKGGPEAITSVVRGENSRKSDRR